MESVGLNTDFWRGRRVFLTGHTGFKGAWLSMILKQYGAEVSGYSLAPPSAPSLFQVAAVEQLCDRHVDGDICDLEPMRSAMHAAAPELVFHLAAQSLVRPSYKEPLKTLADNVMGTANVLECLRAVPSVRAAVMITTDKCYRNEEWVYPYREQDPLGGNDVYSASKACAEIVTHAYRYSFFGDHNRACRIASVRAGNVFGGGDWALDRLVPDCIRAFIRGEAVRLRYPHAVRPWQHVFEPLSGYMLLAERLYGDDGDDYCGGWNFGPDPSGEATVYEMTEDVARAWGEGARVEIESDARLLKEASLLRLDSTKARVGLDWRPRFAFEHAVDATVAWYRAWHDGQDMRDFSRAQIETYFG